MRALSMSEKRTNRAIQTTCTNWSGKSIQNAYEIVQEINEILVQHPEKLHAAHLDVRVRAFGTSGAKVAPNTKSTRSEFWPKTPSLEALKKKFSSIQVCRPSQREWLFGLMPGRDAQN